MSASSTTKTTAVKKSTPLRVLCTVKGCDKIFANARNMTIHIKRVHEKIKDFVCHYCDKRFCTSSDLRAHSSVHGLGHAYKCDECGQVFKNRDSSYLHTKKHNDIRPHLCEYCGKQFFKSKDLTCHIRSHTGERPFKCIYCDKSYGWLSSLKKHEKTCKEKSA